MRNKVFLLAALLPGAALFGQSQTPQAAPEVLKSEIFVRRFSAGATLSVMVLDWMKPQSQEIATASPAFSGLYSTANASKRIGFGLMVQGAVTQRFAVNVGLIQRKVGYKKNSDLIQGIDNPITAADERTFTEHNEDTRARLYDLPVLIRFYTKDRDVAGPRGFIQGGPVVRRVSNITTAIDTTINNGDKKCCDNTPAKPDRRIINGFVAGAGFQLIDDIGIRIVPEFRYTRWLGDTFKSTAAIPQRNQIEGLVSLTF